MTSRGVHFALSSRDEKRVIATDSDEELIELISEDIEEHLRKPWMAESDKAWEPLHRCLDEHEVLRNIFLGGQHLTAEGSSYIVSFLNKAEVKRIHESLQDVTRGWLQDRCTAIHVDDDFEYLWSNFCEVMAFFQDAAKSSRAVIFTADR